MSRGIGETFEMPKDQPGDGVLSMHRVGHHHIAIVLEQPQTIDVEERRYLLVSEAEAAKILGCLSLFLGVRINSKDARQIKLGPPSVHTTKFVFGGPA